MWPLYSTTLCCLVTFSSFKTSAHITTVCMSVFYHDVLFGHFLVLQNLSTHHNCAYVCILPRCAVWSLSRPLKPRHTSQLSVCLYSTTLCCLVTFSSFKTSAHITTVCMSVFYHAVLFGLTYFLSCDMTSGNICSFLNAGFFC